MVGAWPIFDVTVAGFPSFPWTAATRGKALAEAWRSYQNYDDRMRFGDFLRIARLKRRREPVADDGYDYIRRAYAVHVNIGDELELVNEGPETGRRVRVVYPNKTSTAYVHVGYADGSHVIVHPLNVRPLAVKGAVPVVGYEPPAQELKAVNVLNNNDFPTQQGEG